MGWRSARWLVGSTSRVGVRRACARTRFSGCRRCGLTVSGGRDGGADPVADGCDEQVGHDVGAQLRQRAILVGSGGEVTRGTIERRHRRVGAIGGHERAQGCHAVEFGRQPHPAVARRATVALLERLRVHALAKGARGDGRNGRVSAVTRGRRRRRRRPSTTRDRRGGETKRDELPRRRAARRCDRRRTSAMTWDCVPAAYGPGSREPVPSARIDEDERRSRPPRRARPCRGGRASPPRGTAPRSSQARFSVGSWPTQGSGRATASSRMSAISRYSSAVARRRSTATAWSAIRCASGESGAVFPGVAVPAARA